MSMKLYSSGVETIESSTNLLYYRNLPIVRSCIYKNHSIHKPYLFDTCIEIFVLRSLDMVNYIKSHRPFPEYTFDTYDFSDTNFVFYIGYDTNLSRVRVIENMYVDSWSRKRMPIKDLLIERYGYLVYLQIKNIINRYSKKYGMNTSKR